MLTEEIEALLARVEQGLRAARPAEIVGDAERALAASEAQKHPVLRFKAAHKAGWARRMLGEPHRALAHFSTALAAVGDSVGDPDAARLFDARLVFDARLAWVVVARRIPGVPVARLLAVLDKAWLDAGSDAHHQSLVLEERVGVLLDLGRTDPAWEAVQQARPICAQLTGSQRFFSLLHLAWAARKLGHPELALEWLEEAKAMPRATWGINGEAAWLKHLGHTQLALGRPDKACTTANTLWALAPALGQQIEIAAAGLLFEASKAMARWEDAAVAAARQLDLVRQSGTASRMLLCALLDQVDVDLHRGELVDVWRGLEEAEPIAVRLDHDTGTNEQRERVARLRARLGREPEPTG